MFLLVGDGSVPSGFGRESSSWSGKELFIRTSEGSVPLDWERQCFSGLKMGVFLFAGE